jgi:hypothetical protein
MLTVIFALRPNDNAKLYGTSQTSTAYLQWLATRQHKKSRQDYCGFLKEVFEGLRGSFPSTVWRPRRARAPVEHSVKPCGPSSVRLTPRDAF